MEEPPVAEIEKEEPSIEEEDEEIVHCPLITGSPNDPVVKSLKYPGENKDEEDRLWYYVEQQGHEKIRGALCGERNLAIRSWNSLWDPENIRNVLATGYEPAVGDILMHDYDGYDEVFLHRIVSLHSDYDKHETLIELEPLDYEKIQLEGGGPGSNALIPHIMLVNMVSHGILKCIWKRRKGK